MYTVTGQSSSGFESHVTDVKVDVVTPATVNIVLELGNPKEDSRDCQRQL